MARTIIVGDVHGCLAELENLLERVELTSADRLVLVGDLVARGPSSRGVLALVRHLGAQCVLGNHEDRLVQARKARRRGERGPRLGPSHEALLNELSEEDWALLEELPLWLELPEHNLVVVHAGVLPGLALEQQERWVLTRVRTLTPEGQPSDKWSGRLWGELYRGPAHVAFGHNALASLQLHPDATGLDTGCVYGHALTALVLPEKTLVPGPAERRDLLASVPARARYYMGEG